jgi:general stress protein 26
VTHRDKVYCAVLCVAGFKKSCTYFSRNYSPLTGRNIMESERIINRNVACIQKIIDIGDVAMLVSRSGRGVLKSRPMETVGINNEGDIYFFTTLFSELMRELTENSQVNLSFTKKDDNFISVSGVTQVIKNKADLERFWHSCYEKWIPYGLDNPSIILLKVNLMSAEHWKYNTRLNSIRQLSSIGSTESDNVHEFIES